MQFSGQSNDFLDRVDLHALSEIQTEQGPIFSLFLNLREPDLTGRFENLLQQMEQQKKLDQSSPAYREQWGQEAQRVRRWLEVAQPLHGQGLALFSSLEADLWRVFFLPVPVVDRLEVNTRLYTRPLDLLVAEFQCTLVALMDAGTARLIEVSLGQAQEVDLLQTMAVTGKNPDDNLGQYARDIVDRIQAIWQERPCERLLIGGSDEALVALRAALPGELREKLAGEVRLSPLAGLEEILEQVLAVDAEQERQTEARLVEELSASIEDRGRAVVGLEQTLLAIRSKKVRLLVVEEDYHQAGGECPNCGFLSEGDEAVCLLCEMALRPEPDIIEAALNRVMEMGQAFDVLRSQDARDALAAHGQIGALLMDARETVNQLGIATDGKTGPDAQHDQAIEESFPASDPPSWSR